MAVMIYYNEASFLKLVGSCYEERSVAIVHEMEVHNDTPTPQYT